MEETDFDHMLASTENPRHYVRMVGGMVALTVLIVGTMILLARLFHFGGA
jgi:hypothetical protein